MKHRSDQRHELAKRMTRSIEQYEQGLLRMVVSTSKVMRWTGERESGSGRRSSGRKLWVTDLLVMCRALFVVEGFGRRG